MEEDRRQFQPLKIGSCHVETGRDRFMKEHTWQPPETYWHRNNLTALSQRYNLYFIATGASIIVFRPSFPYQKLGDKPILTIPPSLANPSAPGYLHRDHRRHGINHILVGELGSEEILLVCTDSGNVAAYHTQQIEKAVRRSKPDLTTIPTSCFRVRPFFVHWVHESAWGLAIHKQARMIAVSANKPWLHNRDRGATATITVFAFALSSKNEDDGTNTLDPEMDGNAGWRLWTARSTEMVTPDRNINHKIVLCGIYGHSSNIPNISFIGTPQDPAGKWLFSTDITGEMKAWNIWSGKCYRSWNFAETRFGEFNDSSKYGWSIAALDPLAFRVAVSRHEFCGWSSSPIYHGHRDGKLSYDLTNIVRDRVPGSSTLFATPRAGAHLDVDDDSHHWPEEEHPEDGSGGRRLESLSESSARSSESTITGIETWRTHGEMDDEVVDAEVLATEVEEENESDEYLEDLSDDDSDDNSQEQDVIWMDDADAPAGSDPSMTPLSEIGGGMQLEEPSNDVEMLDARDMPGSFSQSDSVQRTSLKLSRSMEKVYQRADERAVQQASDRPPDVPILHCTSAHVRLLSSMTASTPHVFCGHMLYQEGPPSHLDGHFAHLNRMNMIHQIPELGVVVLTSQIGRCAVCTLTRAGEDGEFGLRVDWVLPFQKQEAEGHRPLIPLLGSAVGPIQGRLQARKDFATHTGTDAREHSGSSNAQSIRTSFDEDVVVLNDQRKAELITSKSPPTTAQSGNLLNRPGSASGKRKRSPVQALEPDSEAAPITERRSWEVGSRSEEWTGVENSRRYRLMLTYLDHTVLTYEIWREASELGIATGNEPPRRNLRNRELV